MRKLLFLFIALTCSYWTFGQSIANYSFSSTSDGSLIDISSEATTLLTGNNDDVASTVQNIGFTFNFMGLSYTQFSINSNGQLRLGSAVIGGSSTSPSATAAIIAPMGGDNELNNGASYKVIGISPNRILVVEWNQFYAYWTNITGAGNMQALLYEGSGKIEFIYGDIKNSSSSSVTRSIFISSSNTATTVGSVTVGATPTYAAGATPASNTFAATVTIANLGSIADGSRRVYTFTPPTTAPSAPTALAFSNLAKTSLTLSWTDNATDESGFSIYKSTDDVNYTLAGTVAENIATYNATALLPGTTYYWKVYAFSEAQTSTALSGTQATISLVPLNGLYTINNTLPTSTPMVHDGSGNFASFTDAVNYINEDGISGPVTFNVISGQTFTEIIPAITATGTSANPIIFQKSGSNANPIIQAGVGVGTVDAVITINGADYITFDGIDVQENAANTTSTTRMEYGYYIRNASATNGAQYNTIKNCKVTLNRANTSSRGVYQYAFSIPTNATGTNSNNTFNNIIVENAYLGIYLSGYSAIYPDDNCIITSCTIGASTANDIGGSSTTCYGIRATYTNNVIVSNNLVRNVYTTGAVVGGIFLENVKGLSNVIYGNNVTNISTTSTTATNYVYGIRSDGNVAADIITIANNFVSALTHGLASASTTVSIRAIAVNVGTIGTQNIFYNSVNVNGGSIASSASLFIATGTATHTVKNNIFANFSPGGATSKRFAIYRSGGTLISDNNDLYIASGTNNFVGYYTADQATLANWQTASAQDANSLSVDPQFVSATDLHIAATELDHAGVVIAGITTDIDGDIRSTIKPDIGADEGDFETTAPTVTFNPVDAATDVSVSTTVVLTFSEAVRNVDDADLSVANFTLTDAAMNPVSCLLNYNPATFTATLTPTSALLGNTVYTVTALNVEDISNNALAAPVSASFTTGAPDVTAPTVTAAEVANANSSNIVITFDESVKYTDFTGFTVMVDGAPATISGIAGNLTATVSLTLTVPVTSHQVVTFSYTGGNVTDVAMNPLADITNQAVVNNVLSSEKDILTFNITAPAVTGIINGTNIAITLPAGTDVTALVAEFTNSLYSTVTIGATPQVSGVTANNFTNPVVYTVTAEDGTSKNYTVTIIQIATIPYSQNFEGTMNEGWTTGVTSGTANDWVRGTPAKTQINAAHGGTKAWVTGLTGSTISNNQSSYILSPVFDATSLISEPVLEFWQNFYQEAGWDASVIEISINGGAWTKIDDVLGTGGTFNTPNSTGWYNSSSANGTMTPPKWSGQSTIFTGHTAGWILSKSYLTGIAGNYFQIRYRLATDGFNAYEGCALDDFTIRLKSSANDITAFSFSTPAATGTITGTNIAVTVPAGTNVTALVPTIAVSPNATVAPLTGVAQNFTTPVTYTVTAEDGTTQVYTVTVTVTAPTVAFLPANGTTGVATAVTPTLTFDAAIRNIDDSEITDANVDALITFKTPDAAGTPVAFDATISVDKKVVTITPTAALSLGTNYYISIGATFEEINNLVVAPANSTFTTTELVDWCNLQYPLTTSFNSSSASENIYARVYAAGVTEAAGPSATIQAWIGYNNADTDPATWTNWITATYNVQVGNDDEYVAQLPAGLAEGTYYYASRFQMGTGVYSYGGTTGFWSATNSGVATVTDNVIPTLTSATVENAAPANVVLVFSEPVTLTDATGFTINVAGAPVAINSVAGSGTSTITLTLAGNVPHHAIVALNYDATPGDVQDISAAQNAFASVTDYAVTNNVMNTEKDILTFNITTPAATGTITGTNISIILPAGTDATALVPTITVSDYATVNPASGVAQNFSAPVTYTVTAEDGTTKVYTATVKFVFPLTYTQNFEGAWTTPSTLANWTGDGTATTEWHRSDYTTGWSYTSGAYSPAGANSTSNSARFHSYGITSGLTSSIVSPLLDLSPAGMKKIEFYSINPTGTDVLNVYLSEDGGTTWGASLGTYATSSEWTKRTISVTSVSPNAKIKFTGTSDYGDDDIGVDELIVRMASSAKDILTFDFTTPAASGTITGTDIEVSVPYGTNVTALVPTITISPLATIAPLSGVAQNFTNPVQYTVTAEDGTTKTYTVTVVFDANTATDILTFDFNGLTPAVVGTVNATAHTVALTVPFGTDVTTLVPTITLSYGATVSPSSGTANDFTNAANYVVTAEDATTTQNWTVTVTVAPNTANDILTFDFNGLTPAVVGTVNATAHTVTLTVPYGTDITALVPTITLSPQATVSPLSDVAANFTNPVTYTVTSGSNAAQDWIVTVNFAPNTANDILTFNFNGLSPAVIGTVNATDHSVALTVPYGTNVTALVPTITLSAQAIVNPTSGTPNDFSTPATYTVTSGSGVAQDWTVTVSIAPNTANNILTFNIPTQVSSTINDVDHTVNVTMPAGTDLNGLIPTITIPYGATINPASEVAQDFTNPVQYTVTSESNADQIWTVYVSVEASNGTDILTYTIPSQIGNTVINSTNSTITLTVPYGTDVTNLIATFTLSTGATAAVGTTDQESGVTPNDFTNPVQYIVTAEDGTTSETWTVTVNVALNNAANILTFDFNGLTPAVVGTVNTIAQTVTLTVPYGTDVTALVPTITVSPQATISPMSDVAQNFTNPVTYTVTAGNGTTLNWIVSVVVAPNTANDILTFNFNGLTPAVIGSVNATDHTVTLTVPYGTNVTALVPSITVSAQATVNPASGVAADFTNPVTYTVTSGSAVAQDWTVTVNFAPNTAANILTFDFNGLTPVVIGTVNGTAHTVTLNVPYGTDVTTLVPTITVSDQATINPASGIATDFTSPVTYVVTSGSGATQNWIVTVNTLINTETDILTFNFNATSPASIGVVNATDHTVTIGVPCGTSLTALVPTITLSYGATISPASGVAANFTNPVTYTVTAENGTTTQAWTVTASVINPEITSSTPATRCGVGTVDLQASGTTGAALNWYAAATGGASLGTGETFTTPVISATTSYYVGAGFETTTSGGRLAPTGISATSASGYGLVFDAVKNFTLESVEVYPTAAGSLTVQLQTSTGAVIDQKVVAVSYNGDTIAQEIILGFDVPVATGLRLIAASSPSMIRESSLGGFPYSLGANGSITSGYISGTSTTYYYFYNWKMSDLCESTRTEVVATVTPAPAVTATATPGTICGGETVTLAATSSNTDYTYTWTPTTTPASGASVTATPAATTVFTVNAEDVSGGANNGCAASATVTVNVNPQPSEIIVTPASPSVCAGGIQELTITGGAIDNITLLSESFDAGVGTFSVVASSSTTEADWTPRTNGYVYSSTTFSGSVGGFMLANSDDGGSGSTTNTQLVSPSFSTLGWSGMTLQFIEYLNNATDVAAAIEISSDNFATSTILRNNTSTDIGTAAAFVTTNIAIPAAFENKADVKIRFRYEGSYDWYWAVDEISITGAQTTNIAWTPVTDLYTDANATVAYTGTSETTVYSKPTDDRTYTITATSSENCTRTATVTITVDPVSATLEPVDATCNGGSDGSFTLGTVTCGLAPFTYAVDGGAFGAIPTNLTAGTYSVVIKDADNNLSAPISITIGEPAWVVSAPTSDGDVTICQNATSAMLSVTPDEVALPQTMVIPFNITSQPVEVNAAPGEIVATATFAGLPAGSVVTNVTLNCNGITALGGSWQSDVRLGLSGAIENTAAAGTGTLSSAGLFNYTRDIPVSAVNVAGGDVNLLYWDNYNDITAGADATFPTGTNAATITIEYLPAPEITWYDAVTGGNVLGTEATLEAVGTSVLANTATPGTYNFYAEATYGACTSPTRTLVSVVVNALPTITASAAPSASVCPGTSVTLTANGGTTYTWDNGVTDGVAFIPTATTTYNVTAVDNNGCENTASIEVVVNTLPVVDLGADITVCDDVTVTLDAGAFANYLWNDNSTAQTLVAGTSGTYSVTVTDANGCVDADSIDVVINPNPVASVLNSTDPSVCGTADATISVTDNATYTYAWSTTPVQTTATANNLGVGLYYVSVTLGSCQIVLSESISDPGAPTVTLATDDVDNILCAGSDLTFTAGGLTSGTYSIYVNNTLANTIPYTMTSLTETVDQSFSVYLVGTDAGGCSGTSNIVNVVVNALPVVNLGSNIIACSSTNVVLDAQNPGATYAWTPAGNTQTIDVTTTGTYSVTVTDANACVNADTINVTINPTPVVDLGSDVTVCAGTNVTLDAGNAGAVYTWNTTEDTQTISPVTSGTYSVVVMNAYNCTGADTVVVTINPLPVINFGADINSCVGSTVVLDAQNPGATYAWSPAGNTQTIDVTTTGTYSVTVTDANACVNADTVIVTFNAVPVVNLGSNITECEGTTVTLDAGNAGSDFLWNTTEDTQTISPVASGTYSVIVTNAYNCSGYDTVVVVINPLPVVDLGGSVGFCVGSSTVLDAGNAGSSYLWSTNDATQTITVSTAGTYTVTVTNTNNCSASATATVSENALPTATFAATSPTTICLGDSVQITATFTGAAPYTVVVTDGTTPETYVIPTSSIIDYITPAQTSTVTLVSVTDNNTCSSTVNIDVDMTVLPVPVVNIGADDTLCSNYGETVTLDAGNAGATYLWSDNSTAQTLTVNSTGMTTGVYTYSVTVSNGACEVSDAVQITVDVCGGISSLNADLMNISMYPNPTKGMLTVSVDGASNFVLSIYDATGKEIMTNSVVANETEFVKTLDMTAWPKGMYLVKVSSNGTVKTQTIVLQ